MFLRTPTAFVFVRHVAETAEDTSEGQCVNILKTPRPASLRLAGRSCLRQLVSLEKSFDPHHLSLMKKILVSVVVVFASYVSYVCLHLMYVSYFS